MWCAQETATAGCQEVFGRVASRPGYPFKSPVAGAPSDNRSYPSRLRSQARSALRLAGMAVRPEARFGRRAGRNRQWGRAGGENTPTAVISYRATRAPSANPLCGSSAALRHGEVPLGIGPGRPWLRPNLRQGPRERGPGSDRALRPHHRPTPTPSSTNPAWLRSARVSQQDITSGIGPGRETDQGRSS